jgi:hypothetical protein
MTTGQFGIAASLIYVVFVLLASLANTNSFINLEPNQIGDFFAGIAGPLALFWLVLGFFQQSKELRNSVRALELQTKELSESVKQQEELARVAHDQFLLQQEEFHKSIQQLSEEAEPRFVLHYEGAQRNPLNDDDRKHIFSLANLGYSVSNVSVDAGYGSPEFEEFKRDGSFRRWEQSTIYVWKQFDFHRFAIDLGVRDTFSSPIQIFVRFTDAKSQDQVIEFHFHRSEDGHKFFVNGPH